MIGSLLRAGLLACLSLPAAAIEAKVGGVALTIPDPPSMVALTNQGSPTWLGHARSQKERGNRLVAVFAPPADAARADAGETVRLRTWAVVFASSMEDARIDNGVFTRLIVPGMVDSAREFPSPFGLYGQGPRYVSFGARIPGNATGPLASVINIVNLRDRVAGLVLYSRMEDGGAMEIAAARANALAWTTATVSRNP